MSKNIFQKIINKEVTATIEHEDDDFIVIHDVKPQAPVHLLIIPKHPYASLEEVELKNDAFHANLLQLARKMARKMKTAKNYKLIMNIGSGIQLVQHLHLHLLGGWNSKQIEQELQKDQ